LLNGHQEIELFLGHLAFLGTLPVVGSSLARTTAAVKAEPTVNNRTSSLTAASALFNMFL
jgi:hypothetical protein